MYIESYICKILVTINSPKKLKSGLTIAEFKSHSIWQKRAIYYDFSPIWAALYEYTIDCKLF